jgi:hypothetical protein
MTDTPQQITLSASAGPVLTDLRTRFPDSPFLALGQTALWDEPTKAALRRTLDAVWPEARMVAAAHDTDYFAKLPGHAASGEKYVLVLHDDSKTRGLWSAAGEMSRLFGSEDVPTRHLLEEKGGVSLHRALSYADDPLFLISEITAAWGWTGIIYTLWDRKIARDVPLSDIALTLIEQIEWATQGSAECLEGERATAARAFGEKLSGWVRSFARNHPESSLTELYRHLTPFLYETLLGTPPANLDTSCTSKLLRFNRETCGLPRFAFVDLFLNPITRRMAINAYNLAVAGSDIYTLDRFGEGAVPFDLVIPGRGRGTLCLPGDGTILVETPREPITLCDRNCDFASVQALAALVERELGPDVALVGKAVSLLPMLAAEFILIFHEGGSGYSGRTRDMVARLEARRVALPALRPILRVKYATWDAIAAVSPRSEDDVLVLPEHLRQALGRETIAFDDFAYCWRNAVLWETQRLSEIRELRSPRQLLGYLSRVEGNRWLERATAYETAAAQLRTLRKQGEALQTQVSRSYADIRRWRAEAVALEREKGNDFRANVQPGVAALELTTRELSRAARFDEPIAALHRQVKAALAEVRALKTERLALERGEEAVAARDMLRRIESEAEQAKARLAKNALQTVNGLPHTNYRPSAWWFPLVDPSGAWFRRLAETAEYHLEPLSGHG